MDILVPVFTQAGFTSDEAERIATPFVLKEYAREDHFVRVGQVNRHLGFVETGLFQSLRVACLRQVNLRLRATP